MATYSFLRTKYFSRHTPKGLKKYRHLPDEELESMSRGQRLRALEEEDKTAEENTQKYANKKMKKHGSIGLGAGAALGAALGAGSVKGTRLANAAMGATSMGILGGATGLITGDARGRSIASKEGHDRDKRTHRLARRMDDVARRKGQEDDYEYTNNNRIETRKSREEAAEARKAAQWAAYQSTMSRYGY